MRAGPASCCGYECVVCGWCVCELMLVCCGAAETDYDMLFTGDDGKTEDAGGVFGAGQGGETEASVGGTAVTTTAILGQSVSAAGLARAEAKSGAGDGGGRVAAGSASGMGAGDSHVSATARAKRGLVKSSSFLRNVRSMQLPEALRAV